MRVIATDDYAGEDPIRYVTFGEKIELNLRVSELPRGKDLRLGKLSAEVDGRVVDIEKAVTTIEPRVTPDVYSVRITIGTHVIEACRESVASDRDRASRPPIDAAALPPSDAAPAKSPFWPCKVMVTMVAGEDRKEITVLAIPERHRNLARALGWCALAIGVCGVAVLFVIDRTGSEKAIHFATGAVGTSVGAAVLGRANPFALPKLGVQHLIPRAVLALIVAPLALVIPLCFIVRVRNVTDHTFTIPGGGSSLGLTSGWTVTHRFDESVQPKAMERWLRREDGDVQPCVYGDVGVDAGASVCTNEPRDALERYLPVRQFGVDCRDRVDTLPRTHLTTRKDCEESGELCRLTLRDEQCKPRAGSSERDFRLKSLVGNSARACAGVVHPLATLRARLPVPVLRTEVGFEALPRVDVCVEELDEKHTLRWENDEATKPGFVSVSSPGTEKRAPVVLPVPLSESSRLELQFNRVNTKAPYARLGCAVVGVDRCSAVRRIGVAGFRLASVVVKAGDDKASSFETTVEGRALPVDAFACVKPLACDAPGGHSPLENLVVTVVDPDELSGDRENRATLELPADLVAAAQIEFRTVDDRKPGGTALGTLDCTAPPHTSMLVELVEISVGDGGKRGTLTASEDRGNLGKWKSSWAPGTAAHVNTAWLCRPKVSSERLAVRWNDTDGSYDVKAGTVALKKPVVACTRCDSTAKGRRLTTHCWANGAEMPAGCTADDWKLCECR